MSSTAAREPRNDKKRTDEAILETDAQFIQGLKIFSGDSDSVSGLAGGNAQNSPKAPAGNYLAREGDSMIGPLALGPPVDFRVVIAADDSINISNLGDNPQYSSNIELDAIQPNSFVLTRIDGANFDGQILIIRTFGPDSFTISQMTGGNGGNIQTPDDDDFTLGALQMIALVFDEALVAFSNTGGTWRVLSSTGSGGGSAGTGTFISAAMSGDQITNLAVGNHVEFDTNTPPTGADGLIVLQTGAGQANGIFELKAGKTYFLTGVVRPSNVATNQIQFAWFDITNAVEIGRRTIFNDQVLPRDQPLQEIIFTPTTDVTVELRIVFVTTPANFTAIDSGTTMASIFEFSGQNGEPGPAGSTAWKDPARAKTLVDVPDLANFDVITDGVTLVENDRVLLTEQTTQSENGLWKLGVVAGGLAPLTRPTDFDTDSEVVAQTYVAIEEGSIHKDQLWYLISNNPLSIDVSSQVWSVFAPGTSGGPDLGGGEDGIDGAGQFVNDGRVGIAFDRLKRIQQIHRNRGPTYSVNSMIYMQGDQPTNNVPNVPGRVLWAGRMDQAAAPNASYTDTYGDSFVDSTGLSNNYQYENLAYDPVGEILVIMGKVLTGGPTGNQVIHYSTDRGANFVSTNFVTNGLEFNDLKWVPRLSLFVALANVFAGVNAIWTSPDGLNWTQQVTPAGIPDPPFGGPIYQTLEDSPSLGKIICFAPNSLTLLTSVDAINWINETMTPYSKNSIKLIWSEGQQKFVSLLSNVTPSTFSVAISQDGLVWEQQGAFPNLTQANSFNGVLDLIWAADLSLWLGVGNGDNNVQIFWASHDATTGSWYQAPLNAMRRQSFFTGDSGFTQRPRRLVYSDEFGYIFATGGSQKTAGSPTPLFEDNKFFRTEVYMNGTSGAT